MFYTEYLTNNEVLANVFFAYCEGRSYLWQMFFGWRSTRVYEDEEIQRFIIPTRKVEMLENLAKEIEKTLDK